MAGWLASWLQLVSQIGGIDWIKAAKSFGTLHTPGDQQINITCAIPVVISPHSGAWGQ